MYNQNELYHHGIKGQKWGVRNGPPYPLGTGSHSASENKAGWRKSLDKDNSDEYNNKKESNNGETVTNRILQNYGSKTLYGCSEEIASVASMVVGVGLVAALGAIQKHRNKNAFTKKLVNELKDERYNQRKINTLNDIPRIKSKTTTTESMKVVNPNYPKDGYTDNCALCTATMAMREKGYDVKVNKSDHGWGHELFETAFNAPMVKMNRRQNADQMLKTLNSFGDGAYGHLGVEWKSGNGGHSIFWKNENGRTRIYDGQIGEEYDVTNTKNSRLLNTIKLDSVTYARLDKAEPTKYVLGVINARNRKE